jgi:hypothetical protein
MILALCCSLAAWTILFTGGSFILADALLLVGVYVTEIHR